ncbi:MAG TPA: hypothetical protein VLF67_01280 [Candidatus Saccharimonas sp.]|nr:hypothetical protein [Candidatus Saccharimonas sp.]
MLKTRLILAALTFLLGTAPGFLPAPASAGAYPGTNGQITYRYENINDPADPPLITMNADGSGQAPVSGTATAKLGGWTSVAYSPDGTKIAYSKYDSAAAGPWLYVADVNGANPHRLGYGEAASWSPDGLRLVVGGGDDLSIVNMDGSQAHVLSNDYLLPAMDPSWSPKGDLIAFSLRDPADIYNSQIFTIKPDGTELTQITDGTHSNFGPSWDPTGEAILFSSDRDSVPNTYRYDIYAMDPTGSAVVRLTDTPAQDEYNPVVSPDGNTLLYLSPQSGIGNNLWSTDGATAVDLTPNTDVLSYSWQPIVSTFVYRLSNWRTHERMITINPYEAILAPINDNGWIYEGVTFHAGTPDLPGAVPVYRLSNWRTHERLFTNSYYEAQMAVANDPGWIYEGPAFYSIPCSASTTTIYRMANYLTAERLFTPSKYEVDYAVAHYPGWVDDGVGFCVPSQ